MDLMEFDETFLLTHGMFVHVFEICDLTVETRFCTILLIYNLRLVSFIKI